MPPHYTLQLVSCNCRCIAVFQSGWKLFNYYIDAVLSKRTRTAPQIWCVYMTHSSLRNFYLFSRASVGTVGEEKFDRGSGPKVFIALRVRYGAISKPLV